jgi:hypothetical protein
MSNLKGNLQSISLTDVLQLLHVNKKAGLLQVNGDKATGVLYISNGEVIHAETRTTKGEAAAFDILEWEKGEFEFLASKVPAQQSIRRTVPDLLMEAARTSDSRRRLKSLFPNMDAVPCPTLPFDQLIAGLKLYSEDKKILPFFDGYRTFKEVMAVAETNEVGVLQAASILRDAGRLEVIITDVGVTVGVLKSGFFKKASHLELSTAVEGIWRGMAPYTTRPIDSVRIIWPGGPAVEGVKFNKDLNERTLAIPKDLIDSWGLHEGQNLTVRPAP